MFCLLKLTHHSLVKNEKFQLKVDLVMKNLNNI